MNLLPGRSTHQGWPVVLQDGEITLRPMERRDAYAWELARKRSAAWLHPWDATSPPGTPARPKTYVKAIAHLHRAARRGQAFPFTLEVNGEFAGQVSVNNVVRGSAQFASIGYWIDERFAGRGIMPRAVAMAIDHSLTTAGLHRIEVCIRPENSNSLRVVEKLGLREVGFAPLYLHIDGEWRDHRIFAITAEEMADGLVRRLQSHE
ncbi:N-acetyltransferase GCN5 [Nocardioides baekrokdamisoli]|uniref:N-acetyltransferase GCN5 n=1 Tax=Nocardioides baekrokdamisoli TaxID=1804624 RepID=A0A3G9ITE3_9ACTN|nr:GNAT family protein [Nocardioides baekrokdamisoli]BBH16901.1 N-acetyltransferase GCN5 [Nocardioides baekrokdamisoli]